MYVFFIQKKRITYISIENPGGKGNKQQPRVRKFLVLLGTVETKGSTAGYPLCARENLTASNVQGKTPRS